MNGLQVFNYQDRKVRTVEIDGEPWFVAKDVCDILDIDSTQSRRLPETMRGMYSIQTLGGAQEMTIINEAGVYKLAFTSRKEEAEKFTDWVASDVLPSIRKTGAYMPGMTPTEILAALAQETVKLEKRLIATETKFNDLADTLSEEPQGDWQQTMSNEVRRMCDKYHLDYHTEYSEIYTMVESHGVDLKQRVANMQRRMREQGLSVTQCKQVTKLHIIAQDAKLRTIFESVLKKRKIKHLSAGRDMDSQIG